MKHTAERTWLMLIGLTGLGAWFAETGQPGWPLTLFVAALIAFKGRLVIDHYMEITPAHPRIRRILHGFVTVVPLLVILSHGWSDVLKSLTSLK